MEISQSREIRPWLEVNQYVLLRCRSCIPLWWRRMITSTWNNKIESILRYPGYIEMITNSYLGNATRDNRALSYFLLVSVKFKDKIIFKICFSMKRSSNDHSNAKINSYFVATLTGSARLGPQFRILKRAKSNSNI